MLIGICLLSMPTPLFNYMVSLVIYSYSAWASALLVLVNWAMREPQGAGRATDTDPRAFLFYNSYRLNQGEL